MAMGNPFQITVCEDSVKTVLIFCLPTLWVSAFISLHAGTTAGVRNTARLNGGDAGTLNKKYRDKDPTANKLLTQNVRIGLDGKSTAEI